MTEDKRGRKDIRVHKVQADGRKIWRNQQQSDMRAFGLR